MQMSLSSDCHTQIRFQVLTLVSSVRRGTICLLDEKERLYAIIGSVNGTESAHSCGALTI